RRIPSTFPTRRSSDLFRCFASYGEDVQEYARATVWGPDSCEDEVIRLLQELRRRVPRYDGDGRESYFNAEQNALVLKNAEHYYRDRKSTRLNSSHVKI